jgi:type IV pilus assembly protein PilV
MHLSSRQRGVSLIEVLVAVLIFSLGLIGMAGLLIMATRSNQVAYLRTQVTFLAQNMADRMSSNPMGVWNGKYDGTYPSAVTQDCASGCTPDQLAKYDQQAWSTQLKTFLPNPSASIVCTAANAGYTPSAEQLAMRPPYGGSCTMKVQWTEQGSGDPKKGTAGEAITQTFAWEFQP